MSKHSPAIYRAERDAGLEPAILASSRVCYASLVTTTEPFVVSDRVMAQLRELSREWARAAAADDDLHFIRDIMVSTVWNDNDDVFDPVETWVARATPEHKPLNVGHVGKDILGHIVNNEPIGEDGKVLADDTAVDDLPAKFHIATGSVIYKFWEDPQQQKRVDKIIADIAAGEWFVSMECLFKGFDYALKGGDGSARVVARNDKTAHLTKCLRAYGGTGQYGEYRVGRVLRNILFSGKGLVKKPANPDSLIFARTAAVEFDAIKAERLTEFPRVVAEQVYLTSDPQKENPTTMAIEITELQKQLDGLKVENEQLKASLKDNDLKAVVAQKTKLEADLKVATETVEQLTTTQKTATTELDATKAKLAEAEKTLADVRDELRQIRETEKQAARLAQLKAALKVDEANEEQVKAAQEMAANLTTLSDGSFTKFVAGQTKFTPAPYPPKATPGKEVPAATTKPAAKAAKPAADDTADAAATAADPAVLDAATAATEPALSVAVTDDGVSTVQKEICEFFSVEPASSDE